MRRRAVVAALVPVVAVVAWLAVVLTSRAHGGVQRARSVRGSSPAVSSSAHGGSFGTDTAGAHPQVVEPMAGDAPAAGGAPQLATPSGDPTARAPSLAQVKRELKILNLCGGATSDTLAEPLVAPTGPGFTADPGTTQNVGQLPVLTGRLDQLGKALRVTIYGISGYRTPAHSVAVGGFADDPHTRGEAEDIGVGSLLRSSAAQISEAQLARYGLYRPFDPSDDPNNSEVNHVQLIPPSGPLSLAEASAVLNPDPRCR